MKTINTQDLNPDTLDPATNLYVYNGLDCCVTFEVHEALQDMFDPVTRRTYNFELALRDPIMSMTLNGMKVDITHRDRIKRDLTQIITKLSQRLDQFLTEVCNRPGLNWESTQQLQALLYDQLGARPIRRRNTQGGYSRTTDAAALEKIAEQNWRLRPICNHILVLKELGKRRRFLNTTLDPDHRLRSNWNIAGTNTGRLSSSQSDYATGTNSQNIDRKLRSIFVPEKGMKFANLDLEQADARNVGAVCWNLGLPDTHSAGKYLDACEAADLHTTVSQIVWPELAWTKDPKANKAVADDASNPYYHSYTYRDCAKRTGHGVNYMGLVSVSKATGIPLEKLQDFQSRYFHAFPEIPEWHTWVRTQLETTRQITTLMGRRRTFYGRYDSQDTLREAVAYEPQSVTADVVNTGMLNVWRANIPGVKILAQVHDSILFEFPEDIEQDIVPKLLQLMRVPIILREGREFTIPVEAKVGWNWGDASDDNPHGLRKFDG